MLHDLCTPSELLLDPLFTFVLTFVAAIKPDVRQARQLRFDASCKQQLDTVTIHDVCAMNLCFQHKALRIDQHMTLAAFNLLTAVEAALLTANACCLD